GGLLRWEQELGGSVVELFEEDAGLFKLLLHALRRHEEEVIRLVGNRRPGVDAVPVLPGRLALGGQRIVLLVGGQASRQQQGQRSRRHQALHGSPPKRCNFSSRDYNHGAGGSRKDYSVRVARAARTNSRRPRSSMRLRAWVELSQTRSRKLSSGKV